ncbi:flavin reductase family protein [Pseudomaricurvus alkylphenolicus]|jgi:flavin reductase (DIM6/NTAB) family NADH-FMN oxidoreductase RutF|uniref:flavin reductase family protein n=1 Tax=Pseudomaricurvus alkylphenolicus TaxID=1306991 RepID=UPI00141E3B35|nr:flavin reductase family protein [Pseudomaricurvus alkylphenolicus]NIB41140.1 flavin reductase family protein [Pseudomaricurvus alkylphenolicus]
MKNVDLAQAMREGMRRLASGVCVLSTRDTQQHPLAMTATSVTSVSDEPASLLVCVNKSARIHQAITEGADFCINLLHQSQQEVSNRCAGGDQGESRFEVGNWVLDEGLPYLSDGLAAFFCQQDKLVPYGTHTIVIGTINRVLVSENDVIDPLMYLNGGYQLLAGVDEG